MSSHAEESVQGIQDLYSKLAPRYDWEAWLYKVIGVKIDAYRQEAIGILDLQRGDAVLELGCGTGLNLTRLERAVGPDGHITGIDLTPAMLEQAKKRIAEHGWKNIALIQGDATRIDLPRQIDGILTTFALSIMPDQAAVIAKAAKALKQGSRFVTLDLKLASRPYRFLNPLGVLITKPFGGSYEVGSRKPWELMPQFLDDVHYIEHYLGFVYLAWGTRR